MENVIKVSAKTAAGSKELTICVKLSNKNRHSI